MTPSSLLYAHAGSPSQEGVSHHGRCRLCAQAMTTGQLFSAWAGSSFTDQNKVKHPGGTHVCPACIWVHAWNPPPGSPPQTGKGHNLRMYSHLWHDGDYRFLNKADKPEIRDWLQAPKTGLWFAAISDSGQKHLLPYTPLNPPTGRLVRFEEQTLALGDWSLLDAFTLILTAGVPKSEVETSDYTPRSWNASEGLLRAFEETYRHLRGGAWFSLCLWLAQRDEIEYRRVQDERDAARNTARADRKPAVGRAQRAPAQRRQPNEALGPTPHTTEVSRSDKHQRPRVGHAPDPRPRTAGPFQGSLFGD